MAIDLLAVIGALTVVRWAVWFIRTLRGYRGMHALGWYMRPK